MALFSAHDRQSDWEWAKDRKQYFKTTKSGVLSAAATFVVGLLIRGSFGDPDWIRASLIAAIIAGAVAVALPQLETFWIWRQRHKLRLAEAQDKIAVLESDRPHIARPESTTPAAPAPRPDTDAPTQPPASTSLAQSYDVGQSTAEFHARMCDAFPGGSGLCVESDIASAIGRLNTLLKQPLGDGRLHSPIWEIGFGSSAIVSFRHAEGSIVYLNHYRFRLTKVIGYRSDFYWRDFVLVYWEADEPTGLYPLLNRQEMVDRAKIGGRCTEEYGVWDGKLVTRAEFDDGSVFRNGRLHEIDARLEVRQLLPGVTFLVGQRSPINDGQNDRARWNILDAHRSGSLDAEAIASWVETLSPHRREH